MPRLFLLSFLCGVLAAQQPQAPQEGQSQGPTFRGGVEVVQAPVLVFDRDGNYVSGLQPAQFHLFDNGKEQNIAVDVAFQPISMVICIQANANVEGILPQIRKIGNLVAPIIIGDQGEAAVIAFDSRIRTLQDFTSDPDKITKAVKDLYAGSSSNHLIDAVSQAARMLRTRASNRRRVILYIGETRDIASETRLREALMDIQYTNLVFYPVDISRLFSTMTAKPDPGPGRTYGRRRCIRCPPAFRRPRPPSSRPTASEAAGAPSSSR